MGTRGNRTIYYQQPLYGINHAPGSILAGDVRNAIKKTVSIGGSDGGPLRPYTNYTFTSSEVLNDGPYSRIIATYSPNPGVFVYGSTTWGSSIRSGLVGKQGLTDLSQLEAQATEMAKLKWLKKVSNVKFDLGVFLGELPAAVSMVSQTMVRLSYAFIALKRFDVDGCVRQLRCPPPWGRRRRRLRRLAKTYAKDGSSFAANAWLEFTYGWVPLLSDIYSLHKVVEDYRSGKPPKPLKVSASVRLNKRDFGRSQDTTWDNTYSVIARYFGELKPVSQTGAYLGSLGLTNPLTIAWELTPFSFVVDWALPIGDWLSSLDALNGVKVERVGRSVKSVKFYSTAFNRGATGNGTASTSASAQWGDVNYVRYAAAGTSVNPLLLGVKPEILNASRLTSALALLRQAFK